MKHTTIAELIENELGIDISSMPMNEPIDVSSKEYEVLSADDNLAPVWSLITKVVKKDKTLAYNISGMDLNVSPLHLFYAKINGSEPSWVDAVALAECSDVMLFHKDFGWQSHTLNKTKVEIDILDIEVENTNCWYTNGLLSHNTMFGDPTCTDPHTTKIKIRYRL